MITGYDYRHLPQSAPVSKHTEMRSDQFRFWETAHLPLPSLDVNICVSLGAKCWVRGGVGGQFRGSGAWTVSYKSLYFVLPTLELVPLFTGMRERSVK